MKKVIVLVLVAFLGFWLVTDPSGLAAVAQDSGGWAWTMSGDFASALREFIRAL